MKKQFLSLILLTVFLLSLVAVSATISLTLNPNSLTLDTTQTSGQISLTLNGLANLTVSTSSGLTASLSNSTNVNSSILTISALNFPLGTTTRYVYINATNATNSSDNTPKTIEITLKNNTNPLCTGSNPGNLVVSDIEIDTKDGFGNDEDYWYPMDEVELTFNVENAGSYDIKKVSIDFCLWDISEGKCVLKNKNVDISKDNFKLDYNDDTDVTITFLVDADKLKFGNDNYLIYVSATGEVDDNNDGDNTCDSDNQEIEIRTDDSFVLLSDIFVPQETICGANFELSATVWNIGDDLDSDEVFINIYSSQLNIDETIELQDDLNALESQEILAILNIPANAEAKTYNLRLTIYDDKSLSDKDIYQTEDDEAIFNIPLKVGSCNPVSSVQITIPSEGTYLSDETPRALIGKEVKVKSTIKNTGTSSANITLEITGNTAWSDATIDPKTFTLAAGESRVVDLYIDISPNAEEGDKTFNLRVFSGSNLVAERQIQLSLEKGLTSSKIVDHFKANWVIYLIVLINIILIIAIIAVVARIARKEE